MLDYSATDRSIEDQWRALELPSYDVIFDCVGGEDYWRICQPMLKKGGVYSTAVGIVVNISIDLPTPSHSTRC